MDKIEDVLRLQLDDANEGLGETEKVYQEACMAKMEAQAALEGAKRTVKGLELALAHIRGEVPPEEALSAPVATFDHRDSPEEITDPRERKERQRQIAEAEQMVAENDPSKPKCRGCGRRGTLQTVQHESGAMLQVCSACGNQAVLG